MNNCMLTNQIARWNGKIFRNTKITKTHQEEIENLKTETSEVMESEKN